MAASSDPEVERENALNPARFARIIRVGERRPKEGGGAVGTLIQPSPPAQGWPARVNLSSLIPVKSARNVPSVRTTHQRVRGRQWDLDPQSYPQTSSQLQWWEAIVLAR